MRIWVVLLIMLIIPGCARYTGSCETFTGTYPEMNFLKGKTFTGPQAAVRKGRGIVSACYPLHPIKPEGGAIGFNSAIQAEDGGIYLTYNIQLWSDVRLAFKIDETGKVLSGFQYSTYGSD